MVQCKDGYPVSVAVTNLVGGSAVLHNGAEDLTVSANQTYTFTSYVQTYAVTVTDPSSPAQRCTLGGVVSGTASGPVALTLDCKTLVVARYPTHPKWNHYVRASGPDDVACAVTDGPGYAFCVHAGERRVMPLPDQASCSGLTATDALGAFMWSCELDAGGKPRMVSTQLYPAKRLADLIDLDALAWRANSVTVLKDAAPLRTSASTAWWDNTIEDVLTSYADPGANLYTTLSNSYVIEVVRANGSRNLSISTGDALVVKPGVTLSANGAAAFAVYVQAPFAWVEGTLSGVTYEAVADSANSRFGVVRNVTTLVTGTTFSGSNGYFNGLDATGTITFQTATNETVLNCVSRNSSSFGFQLNSTTNSSFQSLTSLSAGDVGLAVLGTSSGNVIGSLDVSGNGGVLIAGSGNTVTDVRDRESGLAGAAIGIEVSGDNNIIGRVRVSGAPAQGIKISGKHNRVFSATVGDAQSEGVLVTAGGDDTSLTGLDISNGADVGIKVQANNVRVAQATVIAPAGNAIALSGASDVVIAATVADGAAYGVSSSGARAILAGTVTENFSSAGLSVTAGDIRVSDVNLSDAPHGYEEPSPLATFHGLLKIYSFNADCYVSGASATCPATGGDLTVHLSVPATYALFGKVTTDDLANASDTAGLGAFSGIQYWATFDDAFRGWGKDATNAFAIDSRGRCTSGNCRIWSVAGKQNDVGDGGMPVLRGVLATPSGTGDVITQTWTGPSDASTCSALRVANPSWSGSACTSQFLQHAIEIAGDNNGNDNGLCETGEVCLLTPNIGAYAGHDTLSAGSALPTIGAISSVTVKQYATNGY
jgi:hypothetical protein